MKQIITIENDELQLCSNLDEYSFGKTDYNSIVTQEGVIFEKEVFTSWTFSDVKAFNIEGKSERIVFYCGKNPFSANTKTLLEYFEEGGESCFNAVMAVCKAITIAAKSNVKLPMNGAGGILVDMSDSPKVLFVPGDLYKYSSVSLKPEETLQLQSGWVNDSISDLPALCFQRAVIIYRLLTGRLPYAATNGLERNADILDRKFLPLELCINGINTKLAKEVNKALCLNSNAVNIPGKRKKGKESEDLTPTAEFSLDLLQEAWDLSKQQNSQPDQKEFDEKVANYIKIQNSKVSTKRQLRRNSAAIVASIVGVIAVIIATVSTVKAKGEEYTSKGLTSVETLQAYFLGVNNKDTTLLANIVDGKIPRRHVDAVSQVYVLTKQRQAYNHDNGFASPENWLIYSSTMDRYERSGLYGITNLKIDGKPMELDVTPFLRNQKPEPVTKEGNITLTNKAESVHKVEYFQLHSEGENNNFIVEKVFAVFTLTYEKNRWFITDISSDEQVLPVSPNTFKTKYFNEMLKTDGDVIQSVRNLRKEYPWLPTEKSLTVEKEKLEYMLLHPYEDLF